MFHVNHVQWGRERMRKYYNNGEERQVVFVAAVHPLLREPWSTKAHLLQVRVY